VDAVSIHALSANQHEDQPRFGDPAHTSKKGEAGLEKDSDIIIDQIRSLDNKRFREHLGEISDKNRQLFLGSLRVLILE